MKRLAETDAAWAIPWPCIHEFISIATHPKIYRPPMSLTDALRQVENWRESPSLRLIGEADNYWPHLQRTATEGRITGPAIHDARIAAICSAAGVTELWSHDRDFSRFAGLRTRNPLVHPPGSPLDSPGRPE